VSPESAAVEEVVSPETAEDDDDSDAELGERRGAYVLEGRKEAYRQASGHIDEDVDSVAKAAEVNDVVWEDAGDREAYQGVLERMEEERRAEREAAEAKLLEREERARKERENARLEEERVALEEFEKMKSVSSPSPLHSHFSPRAHLIWIVM
jgi:hypothetical protein